MQLLHQLPFRADGVESLQQERPQQPFRRNRRSALGRVEFSKLSIESCKHLVDNAADQPQRMALRHPLFKVHIGKQFTHPLI